ncbi:MAG: helix-turn-helix domain-containing protein [Deltaproteobacteria bacterium]|nr:helix-turn-helix domain-containing protein [Deltaproteobacteria bacterium]MBW2219287.1 helix-turn-helix domain-containing protein [Deltaproteobacteria bacterium]
MKNFDGLTYYQLLEIPSNASFFEIRHAYKNALIIYDEDSLSTYSLFEDSQREQLLDKIEEAFQTLINEDRRAAYNKILISEGKLDATKAISSPTQTKAVPIFQNNQTSIKHLFDKKITKNLESPKVQAIRNRIHSNELVSGEDLKELRQALGVELQEIFEVVRISVSILQVIEANEFQRLPSLLHLNNFLKSYAEILHLDTDKVVDGYIINMTLLKK